MEVEDLRLRIAHLINKERITQKEIAETAEVGLATVSRLYLGSTSKLHTRTYLMLEEAVDYIEDGIRHRVELDDSDLVEESPKEVDSEESLYVDEIDL